jgi:hypothetical protein
VEGNDAKILIKCVSVTFGSFHILQNFVCKNCSYGLSVGIGIWMFESWVRVVIIDASLPCYSEQDPLWSRFNSPEG